MEKVYLSKVSLCSILVGKIKEFKRNNPRLNSTQIAKRFNVATSTFNRIENGDIKTPSIDQVVKILTGTGNQDSVTEVLREYFPELHDGLAQFYSQKYKKESEVDLLKYFENQHAYKMLIISTTKEGLDEKFLLQELGRNGHSIFMKLAAEGIIRNVNGKFFASRDNLRIDQNSALKISSLVLNDVLDSVRIGKKSIHLYDMCYESINMEKIGPKLKQIQKDFDLEMKSILLDPENKGKDIVFKFSLLKLLNDENFV